MPAMSDPNKTRSQSRVSGYDALVKSVEDPMRSLKTLSMVLLLSGLAAAQASVIGGTASNWVPAYGVYAAPFVPLVTTPSVTLATVSPSAAGASNATFGNVAGATNATLSFVSQPPAGAYTQAIWSPPYTQPSGFGPSAAVETAGEPLPESRPARRARAFDVGVASWQTVESATHLMASSTGATKAARTYTNQDVDQVNQKNGTVKYDGKTEHI
jgi:hypothetical protein